MRLSLSAITLVRRSLAQRLHKSRLLWQVEFIPSCRKTPKENEGNPDLPCRLRCSSSSSPSLLPFRFGPFVLHKHILESHSPTEHNELNKHERFEVLQISPHQFRSKPNKIISANSTASGLYAPGQVRTEFCDVAVLIPFRNEADVDAVIAAATLDNLRHRGDESMSKVAYHSGPGGGRDVILNFEPVHQQAAHMTWGMWHSALGDITAYYDREGKIPIKFYVLLSELSKSVTIGRGLLIQDIPHEGDEDSVMEEVA